MAIIGGQIYKKISIEDVAKRIDEMNLRLKNIEMSLDSILSAAKVIKASMADIIEDDIEDIE